MTQRLATGGIAHRPSPDHPGGSVAGYAGAVLMPAPRRITVPGWDGEGERLVEIATGEALWSHPGLSVAPLRWVLIRDPLGRFRSQALLCTDLAVEPEDILSWFVRRWSIEVTFAEARRHLGVETQRQWSDRAVARTTPALLGLYSFVALQADDLNRQQTLVAQSAAWYRKDKPTFSDALAAVRRRLWTEAALLTGLPPGKFSNRIRQAGDWGLPTRRVHGSLRGRSRWTAACWRQMLGSTEVVLVVADGTAFSGTA